MPEIIPPSFRLVAGAAVASVLALTLACSSPDFAYAPSPGTGSVKEPDPSTLAHYEITPASLPRPNASVDAENPPNVIPRPADARLVMPPGFEIATYAEGNLQRPRWLALAPNGDVFVSESQGGRITVLRDTNGDGAADARFVWATGLLQPFGMAFWKGYLYVGNTDAVVRFAYRPGQFNPEGT
jgi:glucose/arabinose dehydrogenase